MFDGAFTYTTNHGFARISTNNLRTNADIIYFIS